MVRRAIKIAFFTFLALFVLGPIILVLLSIESEPHVVAPEKTITPDDVQRIKALVTANDPRKMRPGDLRYIDLAQRDVNVLLLHSLARMPRLQARVDLHNDKIEIHATFAGPPTPMGRYFNVSAYIVQRSGAIELDELDLGRLSIKGWLLNPLSRYAHRWMQDRNELYRTALDSVAAFRIGEGQLDLTYQWRPDLIRQLRAQGRELLMPGEDRDRMRAYNHHLALISTRLKRNASLLDVLQPMFLLADERSRAGGDPVTENKALFNTLAIYIAGRDLNKILGSTTDSGHVQARWVALTLLGRADLAQHFLLSAAITANAGAGVADLLGVFKELDDSHAGSGFSFADLLADRTGVRLAEMGTEGPESARRLQQRLATSGSERDFISDVDKLPEGIMELQFKQRYKDLDNVSYQMVEAEIQRRIGLCSAYQPDTTSK